MIPTQKAASAAHARIQAINAIANPAERRAKTHLILAEEAAGRIVLLQIPELDNPEVFAYHDGSYVLLYNPSMQTQPVLAGQHPTLDAVFRACAELPKACPCPLVVCPESHHRCSRCDTTQDLVSGPDLPLALRRSWCRACWNATFSFPYDYPQHKSAPGTPEETSP